MSGSFTGLAITGNGTFVFANNFSVSFTLGSANGSSVGLPAWLPLQSLAVTISWPNFNQSPTNFLLTISASVNFSLGPFNFNGSVTNLVINTALLADGDFPIVSLGGFSVQVSGNLGGATITGTLIAGIVTFNESTGVIFTGTGTAPSGDVSEFYAGIMGSCVIGGEAGFTIEIGISQDGPLSIYIQATVPIPLGPSTLFLSNFSGGIEFGATFPTINITGNATDALQLRQPAFQAPGMLTASQWQAQLEQQVVTNAQAGATWATLLTNPPPMIIEAGCTLYDTNLDVFRIDGTIEISTQGQILLLGRATFGGELSIGASVYFNISQVAAGTASILFLIDVPSQSSSSPSIPPVYSIYGEVVFHYDSATQVFSITVSGAVQLNVLNALSATLNGTIVMTASASSFTLNVNATLNVTYLGIIGTVNGNLTVQNNGSGSVNVWGALLLTTNLSALQSAGIYVTGTAYFEINTDSVIHTETFANASAPLQLAPYNFSLFIQGTAAFEISGVQVFSVSGTLAVDVNSTDLTIFIQAQLTLGPPGTTLFQFDATGLLYVSFGGGGTNPGFAAMITLTEGASPLPGFTFAENFLLVVNTTEQTISYVIPTPPPTIPATPAVPTVVGPNFASTNVLATESYETTNGQGQRTLVIPDGAPPAEQLISSTGQLRRAFISLSSRGAI